ncbi:syndetin-like isoform X2 [Dysidea avara]|uniref:syndetin-like isoform X2 n=1 Tax=Dysidea avara TaxID=196820 RepID=UPI00331DF429
MAALRSRFKNLLRISDQKGIADEGFESDITETLQVHPPTIKKENPADLAEIISQIDEIYYDDDKDCCQYELTELDKEYSKSLLEDRIMKLKSQELAARKKVSDLVLANYIDYVQELQQVAELQLSLQNTVSVCVNGRRSLTMAKQGVSHGGLGVLAKHRKRQRLNSVLSTLRTLKTLQMTDVRLQEMLKEGNYAGATQLCLECLTAVPMYKQYTCISDLGSKLKDTQNAIEAQLEEVLSSMCTTFEPRQYQQVQVAYRLLGKSQNAIDQLLMHFTSTIHSNAFSVVFEYAKSSLAETEDQKMPYRDLCKAVPSKSFTACLKSLCKAMWKIMKNYYQIKLWHENVEKKDKKEESVLSGDEMDGDEILFNKTYVKQKLELGLSRIWQDVQQKVKPFLVATDMAHFAYDNMIHVLDTVNRLISLGIEFCGKGSDSLQESIRLQSLKYFKTYHRNRLDELRAFLENEAWEICPVRSSFTIHSLREFYFMKNLPATQAAEASSAEASYAGKGSRFESDVDPFTDDEADEECEEIMESTNPFGDGASDDEREDEENEDLHKEFVDEMTEDTSKLFAKRIPRQVSSTSTGGGQGPILSNTTLTVLRLFGNYMQMMHVLKPIASDVLECITQLFDYYLYAIFTFFASDPDESSEKDLTGKMKTTLKRIREQLIFNPQEPSREEGVKVPSPTIFELLNLVDEKTFYGLSPRLVATESLVFIAKQFESLQPYCERCIPETRRGFLQQYFVQTVHNVDELRKPVYSQVSKKAINYAQMLTHMTTVKWDIKEIMSQHSQYVDNLLKEFADFGDKISRIERDIGIPEQTYQILWEMAIRMANRTFVEGFSQAKKCSNEGRALMQLDYQQFLSKLGKLTYLRPIPDHDYVEVYIKAYYLTENDMEKWIQEHREYTSKQVTSLVNCGVGAHLSRKSRQKLLALISDDANK